LDGFKIELKNEQNLICKNFFCKKIGIQLQNKILPTDSNSFQAHELFDLSFLDQTSVLMILLPFYKSAIRAEPPAIVQAKLEKLALRIRLCVEDALEVVDRRKLDDFASRNVE
jgi:hypothetical protein